MGYNSSDGYLSGDDRDSHRRDSSVSGDRPTYPLDHLATLKLNRETGISSPIDGMKRLLEMNQTTGIWPQKMQICFDNQWVLIMDCETGNVIEGFPGALIQEPTAFLCNDPMEIYNNILVFIVGGSMSHTEMHIFQSTSISAIYLVEDLKTIRSGKIVAKRHETVPVTPTRQPSNNHQLRDQYGLREMNSLSKDSLQTDMLLLNHCLEDIEKFVARLHSAAGASRELSQLPNDPLSRTNGEAYGEGLLKARSQLPKETELLDILGKYKLSFNLIAKLKSEIDDQAVPIHCLFTSLELIVEVCREVSDNDNIPAQVVNPLFGQATIGMLNTYVTDSERELWKSLGDAWNVPKEHWVGPVDAYQPIFFDGWSPKCSETESVGLRTPVMQRVASTVSSENVWLRRLESRNVGIAEVIHDHQANNDRELNVEQGEYLEVLDDNRKWWRTRNHRGQVGYVPHTILVKHEYQNRYSAQSSSKVQKSVENDSTRSSTMDSLQAAVLIRQAAMERQAEIDRQAMEAQKRAASRRSISMPNVPPPPPPPPPASTPTTPSATLQRNAPLAVYAAATLPATIRKTDEDRDLPEKSVEDVQEELKHVLLMRERRRDMEILVTPQIYIDQSSTPSEIESWLRGKGFSAKISKRLVGLNGSELFALPEHTIEEYFGVKDGRRLVSQILLQKNFSGYKTARSSELQAVLARRLQMQKVGDPNVGDEVF